MKTQEVKRSSKRTNNLEFVMYALLITAMLILSSCSSDDDVKAPDTRPMFLGAFSVEDISASSGNTYIYDITITNGDNGDLNISNFADMFNIPIKATVDGSKLTIKSQSFTNPSGKKIEVSGSGTITGEVLNFTYTTVGYLNYTGTCKANKKPQ